MPAHSRELRRPAYAGGDLSKPRASGCDFFATTDHGFVTEIEVVAEDFLWLRGVELDGDVSEIGEYFHVVGFGLAEPATAPAHSTVSEALAWTRPREGFR